MRIPITSDYDFRKEETEMTASGEPGETLDTHAQGGINDEESAEGWKHRCLCMKADFENYKRHAGAERNRLAELGKESVLAEIFPIAEHLERAVAEAKKRKGNKGIIKGLELVQKDIEKIFEKYGIERIPTVGESFDPEVHEAVAVNEKEDAFEGEIIEETHPGFIRNGRLLCPARVVVAK